MHQMMVVKLTDALSTKTREELGHSCRRSVLGMNWPRREAKRELKRGSGNIAKKVDRQVDV